MELFTKLEGQYGLPSGLLDSVWSAESGRGRSMLSSAGAQGHFQFMPATAKQYGLQDPNDLQQSAGAAARMLSDLMKQTGGDLGKALAGYNWGIGNVQRKGMEAAPAETRNYIAKVTGNMQPQDKPDDEWGALNQKFVQASPATAPKDDEWGALAAQFSQPTARPATSTAAAGQAPAPSRGWAETAGDLLAGAVRGAGSIGATLVDQVRGKMADPISKAVPELMPPGAAQALANAPRGAALRTGMDEGLRALGAQPESWAYKGGKLGGEIAGTAGVGGLLAKPVQALAATRFGSGLEPLINGAAQALQTSGFRVGELAGTGAGVAARIIGGGISGGATAGLVNPEDAATGALIGGALPIAAQGAGRVGSAIGSLLPDSVRRVGQRLSGNQITAPEIDAQINLTLERAGMNPGEITDNIRRSIRTEVADAMRAGREVNPDALRRLADFRALGVTPTRGMVSQDPVRITQEMNLAKIGANSSDGGLQGLALIQNQNNARLIQTVNEQGAARGDVYRAGETVADSVLGRQAQLRAAEQAAWDAAKASPGYRQPISSRVISDVNQALGDEGLMPFMNPTISKYMEAFQKGQTFTPQDYRNLQSMLSREIAKGSNEGAAARVAAKVLSQAEVQPLTNPGGIDFGKSVITGEMAQRLRSLDAAPASAIDAVNQARNATRAAYAYEDASPLVRSVLSGSGASDPARIAQKFIIGGTPNEARQLAQEVGPQGIPVVRDAILNHLKDKALSGASDEVGKFSQSAFNKALNQIGDRKLSVFFSPEELANLRMTGRVASYMQVQPVGSAVNNSNSGALLLGRGLDFMNKIPVIGPLAGPALQNINISLQQRAAQNVGPAIMGGGLLAEPPLGVAARGLLSAAPVLGAQ